MLVKKKKKLDLKESTWRAFPGKRKITTTNHTLFFFIVTKCIVIYLHKIFPSGTLFSFRFFFFFFFSHLSLASHNLNVTHFLVFCFNYLISAENMRENSGEFQKFKSISWSIYLKQSNRNHKCYFLFIYSFASSSTTSMLLIWNLQCFLNHLLKTFQPENLRTILCIKMFFLIIIDLFILFQVYKGQISPFSNKVTFVF